MKNPTPKSPKNKYVAEINYKKPLLEIGSTSRTGAMSIEDVKHQAKFYTEQAKRNKTSSTVVIKENIKVYPKIEWVEIERYEA